LKALHSTLLYQTTNPLIDRNAKARRTQTVLLNIGYHNWRVTHTPALTSAYAAIKLLLAFKAVFCAHMKKSQLGLICEINYS
tara:strand:- start:1297 stop:1542 length:246 start_codon:yes stop_codon:yes gene_type:complete